MKAPRVPNQTKPTVLIRLLTTTDLHGHLLPYDYIKDQPTQGGGLAGLARLIKEERARAQAANIPVVLLDNGDTFQGTPLASHLARSDVGPDQAIVACMNHLEYDALGLGNHDLDHGLPYIREVAAALDMPLLSSNLRDIDMSPLRESLLFPVDLGPDAPAPLTLGILSVLPAMSAAWHSYHLGQKSSVEAPETAVAGAARALRDAGADLVIVLAHMGVGLEDGVDSDARAAQALASDGEIDALILGHTHRRLPSADYTTRRGVDIHKSTLRGVPALMAGHAGSDLGLMDLALAHDPTFGWTVSGHECRLLPNGANVLPDPVIVDLVTPTHDEVRAYLCEPVAMTPRDLHSYFSLVSPTPTQQLTAHTQHRLVSAALAGTEFAELPVLATAAAHGAGGRDGVGNYIHVPEGRVLRRHLAGLNPFTNQAMGIRIGAAELRQWLEHAALLFNALDPRRPDQMLVNPDIPAFHFDTIFGLQYTIDPGAPPGARIADLTYQGAPLFEGQQFILATNHFRVSGGGGYRPTPTDRIVVTETASVEEGMLDTLRSSSQPPWGEAPPWRFSPSQPLQASILTHPDAMTCISDISHLRPVLKGTTPDGFIRLSVTL
jgi:2',3'-cyclic-nucleotide 2'-phosphodiesterase/3'-nucleotidase